MSKKSLLFISLSGSDASLPASRYKDIGQSGDDVHWVKDLLGSLGVLTKLQYQGVRAYKNEPIPNPSEIDAVILGGSYHSINDGFQWQKDMMVWLEAYRKTGRPLLGICGGHQMMSSMLGSSVERLDEAPFAGSFPITLSSAGRQHFLFEGMSDQPIFHFANSEYVIVPPAQATVLGSTNAFTTAALDYGDQWLSVQFHPEMTHDVIAVDFKFSQPELVERYYPLPDAPKLPFNYLNSVDMLN